MRKIIAIFVLAGLGLATTSCFQRSCPTYAKKSMDNPVEKTVVMQDQEKI